MITRKYFTFKKQEVICKLCIDPFVTYKPNQDFCSKECKTKYSENHYEISELMFIDIRKGLRECMTQLVKMSLGRCIERTSRGDTLSETKYHSEAKYGQQK